MTLGLIIGFAAGVLLTALVGYWFALHVLRIVFYGLAAHGLVSIRQLEQIGAKALVRAGADRERDRKRPYRIRRGGAYIVKAAESPQRPPQQPKG